MDLSEVDKFETPTTVLSELIRRGAKLRPQCRGAMFADGGSCALGAAYEALGNIARENRPCGYSDRYAQFVELFGKELIAEIFRLNDDLGMTREAIADLLEERGL